MADLKTRPTDKSVADFINSIEDPIKKKDSLKLLEIFEAATGEKPVMWGDSIVGYGSYHYKYASGQEGDWALTGFSPRKNNLTVYIMSGFEEFQPQLQELGKFKSSVSCLYIKKLDDVDTGVLKNIITESSEIMRARYP